jgi:hypothetical protein
MSTPTNITVIRHPSIFTYECKKICKIIINSDKNVEMIYNNCHPIPFTYTYYCVIKCDDIMKLEKELKESLNDHKVDLTNNDFYYEESYDLVSKYLLDRNIAFYIDKKY